MIRPNRSPWTRHIPWLLAFGLVWASGPLSPSWAQGRLRAEDHLRAQDPPRVQIQNPQVRENPQVEENPGEAEGENTLADWARKRLREINSSNVPGDQNLAGRLERVRAMYFLSVDEGKWVGQAQDSLSVLRPLLPVGSEGVTVSEAYRGALQVVRAKHARWPPNKLKYLNRGAQILDDLIDRQPENLEVRYLRLASYLFLPFFLKRDDSVREDLRTLAKDLPDHPEAFSPAIYQAVLRFVLDNGVLESEERVRLQEALTHVLPSARDEERGPNGDE